MGEGRGARTWRRGRGRQIGVRARRVERWRERRTIQEHWEQRKGEEGRDGGWLRELGSEHEQSFFNVLQYLEVAAGCQDGGRSLVESSLS